MERFEHFELRRELGRGATAKIYLARNLKTNDEVSLKIFHPKIFHDPHFAQRIAREIKLSASLKHDNIVAVREVITHTDPPALVMDYIEGENLETFQSRLPYVLPEVSALIVCEILKGLEYAHEMGLIHRDLKPENVLIRKDGRVFVTDFGLAKLADTTLITQANVILGSLDYMSPEQSRGDSVTVQSDLFSVAMILYFLTTGTRPFSRETTLATLQAIREEEVEHPSKRNPKLSTELSRLIQKGLSKKPEDRFASAKEFREQLESYLARLGMTSENFDLSRWIRDSTGMTMEGLRVCVEHLTRSCERALKERKKDRFLETLSHLTLKAPQSPAIARLTLAYRESRENKRKPLYLTVASTILLLGPCSYWYFTRPSALTPNTTIERDGTEVPVNPLTKARPLPAKAETASEPKVESPVVVAPTAQAETAPPPRPTRNRITPKPPKKTANGVVHFNVDSGVQVFWDGREIDPSEPLGNQTPGVHQIVLIAPGYEPIRGKVMVKDNEPTVVNAR